MAYEGPARIVWRFVNVGKATRCGVAWRTPVRGGNTWRRTAYGNCLLSGNRKITGRAISYSREGGVTRYLGSSSR